MYLAQPKTSSFADFAPRDFGEGFGAAVTAADPRSNQECRAEERRISPVVEPPASELVTVERRHGGPRQLHRDAYTAYQRLKAAAEADGIPANLLTIVSAHRSVASQRALWEAALRKYGSPQAARQWVAPPGGSAHHTGRAIDFFLGGPNNSENVAQLRRTAAYRWLVCNAARFGFYPYAAEPWHWEYNPPPAVSGSGTSGFYGLTGLGEPVVPNPALLGLVALSTPQTAATVANALAIVRLISQFHSIPWRVPFVVLEHEGGVRLFNHHDGVMQTTDGAKTGAIRSMPRDLKLVITGRSMNDPINAADLNTSVRGEFPRRLAVQIACGIQELKNNLDQFNNYIALALIAYNAGSGNAARVVTGGQQTSRPRSMSDALWETNCRFAAMLYHQPMSQLRITRPGVWQCDKNIPAWFQHYVVFDRQSGVQLIAFKYLRSFQACIPGTPPPRADCNATTHGQRRAGSGNEQCQNTRAGALDKIYNPSQLAPAYRTAVATLLAAISDDGFPLKAQNGRMVKMPHASGPVAPQAGPFDGLS